MSDAVGLAYCPSFGVDGFNIIIIVLSMPVILFSAYYIWIVASALNNAYQSITMHKMVKYGNIGITGVLTFSSIFGIISVMNCAFANENESENAIESLDDQSSRTLAFALFCLGIGLYCLNLTFLYQYWKVFSGSQYMVSLIIQNILFLFIILSLVIEFLTLILYFLDPLANEILLIVSIIFCLGQMILILCLYLRSLIKITIHQMSIDAEYNENLDNTSAYASYFRRTEKELSLAEREKTLLKVGTRCLVLYSVIFGCNLFYCLFTGIRYSSIDDEERNSEFLYYINGMILIFSNFFCILCVYLQFDFASLSFEKYCDKCFNTCESFEKTISLTIMKRQMKDLSRRMNRADTEDLEPPDKDLIQNTAANSSGAGGRSNNNNNNNNNNNINTNTNTSNESNYDTYSAVTIGTTTFNDSGGNNNRNKNNTKDESAVKNESGLNHALSKIKNVSKNLTSSDDNRSRDNSLSKSKSKSKSQSNDDNMKHDAVIGTNTLGRDGNNSLSVHKSGNFTHDIEEPILNRDFSVDPNLDTVSGSRGRSAALSTKDVLAATPDDDFGQNDK